MTAARVVNRVVSAVLALVLLAGGIVVAIEIALHGLGRDEPWLLPYDRWYTDGITTAWSDGPVRAVSAGLVALALILLIVQLVRRKPVAVVLQTRQQGVRVEFDRRSLEGWLARRLGRVDGVASAKVRADRQTLRVGAAVVQRDTTPVQQSLERAAHTELEALALARRPAVRVKVDSRNES